MGTEIVSRFYRQEKGEEQECLSNSTDCSLFLHFNCQLTPAFFKVRVSECSYLPEHDGVLDLHTTT